MSGLKGETRGKKIEGGQDRAAEGQRGRNGFESHFEDTFHGSLNAGGGEENLEVARRIKLFPEHGRRAGILYNEFNFGY